MTIFSQSLLEYYPQAVAPVVLFLLQIAHGVDSKMTSSFSNTSLWRSSWGRGSANWNEEWFDRESVD